jgi:MerR family copper efflux transcriptional regulator
VAKRSSPRVMQIGEIAETTGLSLRTLRHYDEIGLLVPSARSEGGFRLYTQDDLDKLLVIRRMKPLGYSLEAMQEVMTLIGAVSDRSTEADPELLARLREVVADAEARRQRLHEQLRMADEFVGLLGSRCPEPPRRAGGSLA